LAVSEAHWSRKDVPCISIASLSILLDPLEGAQFMGSIALCQSVHSRLSLLSLVSGDSAHQPLAAVI
jgi:hypothetical protein